MLYFYNMSNDDELDAVFKALANAKRRAILDMLQDGPKSTGELCAALENMDRCTVMQHIGVLEKAGLIVPKKEGRVRWNVLNITPIQAIYERWIKSYQQQSAAFIASL